MNRMARKGFAFAFRWVRTGTDDYRVMQTYTNTLQFDLGSGAENFDNAFTQTTNIYSVGAGSARERTDVLDEIDAIFRGVEDKYYFALDGNSGGRYFFDGADATNGLRAKLLADLGPAVTDVIQSTQSVNIYALAVGSEDGGQSSSPDGNFPSICQNSDLLRLRWDGSTDVDIFLDQDRDGVGDWYKINSTAVTSQAELQTFLETLYPDDNYLFAYHVNTGDICINWQEADVGNGGFTFSVDLQENIIIEDDVTAHVIRGYEKSWGKWI
jgi:hypothetical protein